MSRSDTNAQAAFRLLPAIDELLRDPRCAALIERGGRELVQRLAASLVERWRGEIRAGALDVVGIERRSASGAAWRALEDALVREEGRGVVRCVNATGVVLNTGLGRAPVHPEVAEAMAIAAQSYCVLEVDRWTNERNQRDDYLSDLLARLTGAEAALGVNNCAGAVLLLFQTFAGGREAIVSRGELVEIGGSFRVPDVMARANARLVEVGTTNRTRISDYESAITERTGLLAKVHTSNFRVVGFTEEVSAADLAELGARRGITTAFDLGSGLFEIEDEPRLAPSLGDEPLVRAAVESGVDVVMFSGDKLLGAPQGGLVVGKQKAITALRKNPIYRALRLDKVALAGIERTLEMILDGRANELPTRAMLTASASVMRPRAETIAARLARIHGLSVDVVAGTSQPGSGAAPGIFLATFVVRVRAAAHSPGQLAARLRAADVPVFVRVQDDRVLVDPRTLLPGDEDELVRGFEHAARTDDANSSNSPRDSSGR